MTLGALATPITQAGLTVNLTATTAPAHQIYLSGAGDTVNASAVTTGSGTELISAVGAGSTILGGIGATSEQLIVGANGTVTMLQGVAAGVGVAAVTGDTNANFITVGTNSTVNLGTNSVGLATDGGSNVTVTGNTAGALSSGAFSFTTTNNILDKIVTGLGNSGTQLVFAAANAAVNVTGGLVNVASASTLGAALDLAASHLGGFAAGTNYADWFQYSGNTYVLDHVGTGAAATAMATTDIIVKITGQVNLLNFSDSGAVNAFTSINL